MVDLPLCIVLSGIYFSQKLCIFLITEKQPARLPVLFVNEAHVVVFLGKV